MENSGSGWGRFLIEVTESLLFAAQITHGGQRFME